MEGMAERALRGGRGKWEIVKRIGGDRNGCSNGKEREGRETREKSEMLYGSGEGIRGESRAGQEMEREKRGWRGEKGIAEEWRVGVNQALNNNKF